MSYNAFFSNFEIYDLGQISTACSPTTYQNSVWRDFRLSVLSFAMVARKVLKANLQQKSIFRSGILGYHC